MAKSFPRCAQTARAPVVLARKALVAAALLVTMPAYGQMTNCMANGAFLHCNSSDGTYTTCNATGTILNCNTMGQHSYAQPSAQGGGAVGGISNFIRSMKARRVQARVAKALRAGNCSAAVDEAFKGQDMDFALNLQSYCAGAAAATTPGSGRGN